MPQQPTRRGTSRRRRRPSGMREAVRSGSLRGAVGPSGWPTPTPLKQLGTMMKQLLRREARDTLEHTTCDHQRVTNATPRRRPSRAPRRPTPVADGAPPESSSSRSSSLSCASSFSSLSLSSSAWRSANASPLCSNRHRSLKKATTTSTIPDARASGHVSRSPRYAYECVPGPQVPSQSSWIGRPREQHTS